MLVDEQRHRFGRRSSSAWAKKAAALRRISFARRSSRISRSSSLIRARSSLVNPPRRPVSTSVLRTHFRSVSGVQPILAAIETIADHCELCSCSCSNTIRTARSRTSGEYLIDLVMTPSSQTLESPAIPGRFTRPVSPSSWQLLLPTGRVVMKRDRILGWETGCQQLTSQSCWEVGTSS